MPRDSGFPGGSDDEQVERPRPSSPGGTGPRPSVTQGIPQRRGTGIGSQGWAGAPGAGGPPRDATPGQRSSAGAGAGAARPPPGGSSRRGTTTRFFPPQPRSMLETGLSATMVEELVLKALFFAGELRGSDIANRIKLPQLIIDEVIESLRKAKYIDLKGGGGMGVGKSGMIYTLTTFATDLIRQILDRNRYNGPAPVRLEDWFEAVNVQTVRGMRVNRTKMEQHFGELVVKDYIFDGLGPAINSGKAVFFYGPPGNGKTALCQALVECYEGEIWVPHALLVDDFIIRVFDSTLHKPSPDDPNAPAADGRWVRCRRPLVVVGGELTLQTLDLIYSPDVKFYEAPFQLKATNGMLLIDDFGRQKVSPIDLLNRWIVPLESEVDFLTLHTGKKLQVPFNVFVAFSTNLDPADLVDDAFLRRVRYKLEVRPPDEDQFHQIWEGVCQKRGIAYDAEMIDWLIEAHYRPHNRGFAACQPRDLLDQVIDIAHYRGEIPHLSGELLEAAVSNYFVKFKKKG
ncbi:MAG: ATPase [Myxococcales bacterium]|nr:ATPase [Myxococcales bacterium]MDP3501028.1 ATPase [Myxococcales bacterium]